jgi:acyl carrier protein
MSTRPQATPGIGPDKADLLTLMERVLKLHAGSIGEHSDIHNTRRWDSLRHMVLMAEIERGYGIELSDSEIASATSVAMIRQLLRDHGR